MTLKDFAHILADASQLHEGWGTLQSDGTYAQTDSTENMNPGNLNFASQPNATQNGRWASFPDFYSGKQAQLNQLMLDLTRYDTIASLVSSYAPPTENDTQAYINAIILFFAWRNLRIGPNDSISSFVRNCDKPVILIAVNQLYQPADWHAIQQVISQCASDTPGYTYSCRYSNQDISSGIETINTVISPTTAVISQAMTESVLLPYNEGQVGQVLIYSGAVMLGREPAGGCEWQGMDEGKEIASSSVLYQGPMFVDPTARILFHEMDHMLFTLTAQEDTTHQYLMTHGGYAANLAVDLEAVYNGSDLNNANAIINLKKVA